ncbi:MAG: hypothetical protein EBR10_08120 [Planctomycetes bacterium]|nr:hypothetical protein [Planctomycetota bacterium]
MFAADGSASEVSVHGDLLTSADVLERLAPYSIFWDRAAGTVSLSVKLRKYWQVPTGAFHGPIRLARPFRGDLQPQVFENLTGMVLALHAGDDPARTLRGEIMPLDGDRWIFAGLPPISCFDDLGRLGLALSDLPLTSGLGDSIIAVESAQVSLRQAQQALADLEAANAVLGSLNQTFERFVPSGFLSSLGMGGAAEAALGAHVSASVTTMFADLRGFTRMSEQMKSAQVFQFLNRFLAFVSPAIRSNGGFIVHYMGDGLLALFPGPSDGAVRAAIQMQRGLTDAVVVGGLDAIIPPGSEARMGIGLSYGDVEMGIIGDSGRWDPAVISDSVNVAARLEEHTKLTGSQILTSSSVNDAMLNPEEVHIRRVGSFEVRGRESRVDAHEVLDSLPLAERTKRILNRRKFESAIDAAESGDLAKSKELMQQYLAVCPEDPAALHHLQVMSSRR